MRHERVGDAAALRARDHQPRWRPVLRSSSSPLSRATSISRSAPTWRLSISSLIAIDRGHVPELERDRGHRAGALRRRDHLLGLRDAERERLLAQHVLAGGQRREHRAMMVERRRRDRHDVELHAGEHRLDRAERVRDLALARDALGARRRRDRDHLEARVQRVGRRVHRAAEAGADDADAQRAHARSSVSRDRGARTGRARARAARRRSSAAARA